jgi:hypothetical protein
VLAWRRRCCRANLVEAAGAQAWEPDESGGHLDAGCAGVAEAAEQCAVGDGVMVEEVAGSGKVTVSRIRQVGRRWRETHTRLTREGAAPSLEF